MTYPQRIEGYAIVSVEGMIAHRTGPHPEKLKNAADLRYFLHGLDKAAAVVHGRDSRENDPGAERRARLVLTRRVAGLARDPANARAWLWNPEGASFEEAWRALGVTGGLAVIGGTQVFGLFLKIGYDAFHLSRSARAHLGNGRPLFPQVPAQTPEAVLAEHGLVPGPARVLDAAAGVSVVTWVRRGSASASGTPQAPRA